MFKFIILILCLRCIVCDDGLDAGDVWMSKVFKFGDPATLFHNSIGLGLKLTCQIGGPPILYQRVRIKHNRAMDDCPLAITAAKLLIEPAFKNVGALPTCRTVERDGIRKAKLYVSKIDEHVKQAKIYRDQFVSAMNEASHPNTTTTLPLLVCYGRKYMEKTIGVYPNEYPDYLGKFVRQYMDLMLVPFFDFLETESSKAPDNCELPPPQPTPTKYSSIQIPALKAAYNLLKIVRKPMPPTPGGNWGLNANMTQSLLNQGMSAIKSLSMNYMNRSSNSVSSTSSPLNPGISSSSVNNIPGHSHSPVNSPGSGPGIRPLSSPGSSPHNSPVSSPGPVSSNSVSTLNHGTTHNLNHGTTHNLNHGNTVKTTPDNTGHNLNHGNGPVLNHGISPAGHGLGHASNPVMNAGTGHTAYSSANPTSFSGSPISQPHS